MDAIWVKHRLIGTIEPYCYCLFWWVTKFLNYIMLTRIECYCATNYANWFIWYELKDENHIFWKSLTLMELKQKQESYNQIDFNLKCGFNYVSCFCVHQWDNVARCIIFWDEYVVSKVLYFNDNWIKVPIFHESTHSCSINIYKISLQHVTFNKILGIFHHFFHFITWLFCWLIPERHWTLHVLYLSKSNSWKWWSEKNVEKRVNKGKHYQNSKLSLLSRNYINNFQKKKK